MKSAIFYAGLVSASVLATILWVIYLVRLVENNEFIQEFRRNITRKSELKFREAEDKKLKRIEESARIRTQSTEMEKQSLFDIGATTSQAEKKDKK